MCSVVARGRGRSGVEHSTNDPSFSDKSFFTKGLFFITYPTTGTYSAGHLAKDPFVAVFGSAHSLADSFKDPAVPIVGITSVDHFTAASCEGTVTARFTIGTYFGEHVKYCIKDSYRLDFHKVTVICTGPFVEDSSAGPVTALTCTGYFVKDSFAAGLPTVTDFAVHVAKNLPR